MQTVSYKHANITMAYKHAIKLEYSDLLNKGVVYCMKKVAGVM